VTTAPVPNTTIRAAVESGTKLDVGTVRARTIWVAPSIANVVAMTAVRIVTPRRRRVGTAWPSSPGLGSAWRRSARPAAEVGGRARLRPSRDSDHAGDRTTAQLDRQRVPAGEHVRGEGDDHRGRGHNGDRLDATARDPDEEQPRRRTASVMASAPTEEPVARG